MEETKRCSKCGETKAVGEFHTARREPSGRKGACKACVNEEARRKHTWRRYKVSRFDFERRVEAQGGRCAICQRECRLVIDHDHGTGKVRQLLCYSCNAAIGLFKDDPDLLVAAAKYLRYHKDGDSIIGPLPLVKSSRSECGYRGVSRNGQRWRARILVGDRMRMLGLFDTAEAAAQAYAAAKARLRVCPDLCSCPQPGAIPASAPGGTQ